MRRFMRGAVASLVTGLVAVVGVGVPDASANAAAAGAGGGETSSGASWTRGCSSSSMTAGSRSWTAPETSSAAVRSATPSTYGAR